jgi:hypothetical protein
MTLTKRVYLTGRLRGDQQSLHLFSATVMSPKASSFVPISEWAYGDRSTLDAGDRRAVAERGQIDPPTNKLKTILRHGT